MTWLVCMKMVTRSVYLNRFRTCRRFTPKEKKMKELEKRNTEAKVLNRVRRRPSRHSSMFAFLLAAWLPLLPRCCLVTDSLLVVCSLCDLGIWDYVVWKSWGRERVELVRWDSRVEFKGGGVLGDYGYVFLFVIFLLGHEREFHWNRERANTRRPKKINVKEPRGMGLNS